MYVFRSLQTPFHKQGLNLWVHLFKGLFQIHLSHNNKLTDGFSGGSTAPVRLNVSFWEWSLVSLYGSILQLQAHSERFFLMAPHTEVTHWQLLRASILQHIQTPPSMHLMQNGMHVIHSALNCVFYDLMTAYLGCAALERIKAPPRRRDDWADCWFGSSHFPFTPP